MLEGEWGMGQNPVTRSSLGADPLDALLGGAASASVVIP
jgi:hypothetical protein